MSDLISRADSLEAVRTLQTYKLFVGDDLILVDKAEVQTELMMLPSAQPEIIHCRDCKYQSKGSNECESWNLCVFRPWLYVPINDDDFCSHAERRTNDKNGSNQVN